MPSEAMNKLEQQIAIMALSALPRAAHNIVMRAMNDAAKYEKAIGALRLAIELLQSLDVDREHVAYVAAAAVLDEHDGVERDSESPHDDKGNVIRPHSDFEDDEDVLRDEDPAF